MNENIDLTKILKNCPRGFKLYSAVHGEVTFLSIEDGAYSICVLTDNNNCTAYYTPSGKIYATCGECALFPSKDQRDWSKFTAPWYKKDRFDPKTLKTYDKVIVRISNFKWKVDFFSHNDDDDNTYPYKCVGNMYTYCIPYNDDTKHLVGKTDEAPDFYKYWEN